MIQHAAPSPIPSVLCDSPCTLCPRQCRPARSPQAGFCGVTSSPRAARAALHAWEEPCISGPEWEPGGSGTVFFSGCTLRCCFCQNHKISRDNFGRELTSDNLADIFLRLQEQGAHNINLVAATQFLPSILPALDKVRHKLSIPIVYNSGGYERVPVVQALKDYVDIWLPDLKYFDSRLAWELSRAGDYFEAASAAITQMTVQTGPPVFEEHTCTQPELAGRRFSLMTRGVIILHLVLPGHRDDSIALLRWIHSHLDPDCFLLSLMSQYTPALPNPRHPELNRRLTSYEYDKVVEEAIRLGLTRGYMQKKSSAREEYTPPFGLEGLEHI